jgi:hypothetical protein
MGEETTCIVSVAGNADDAHYYKSGGSSSPNRVKSGFP